MSAIKTAFGKSSSLAGLAPARKLLAARSLATTAAPSGDAALKSGSGKVPITVAYGDGIGPEIMDATLKIIDRAGAKLDIDEIVIGEKAYQAGYTSGIAPESLDSLRRTKVVIGSESGICGRRQVLNPN